MVCGFYLGSMLEDFSFVVGRLWRFMGFGSVGFVLNH